jgi:citrate synthase
VAHLLITGSTPDTDRAAFTNFRDHLRRSRRLPSEVVDLIRRLPPETHPTRLLRAGVSALGCHELSVDDDLAGTRHWRDLRIVGQVAALVGEIAAHRARRPSPEPRSYLNLAEGMLAALTGASPDPADVRILDLLWVLYAAHGLDAPTLTSMVVASCLADPYFNVVAGLSALRGSRQGGACEAVMEQLNALDEPRHAEQFVRSRRAHGHRIAGFGHRSYRMPDPRVVILRRELAALARDRGRAEIFETARAIETAATALLSSCGAFVNINFYGAPLFSLLGADASLIPCLFAVGRTAGMVALVREAMDSIRLIRPLSRYVGHLDRRLTTEPVR